MLRSYWISWYTCKEWGWDERDFTENTIESEGVENQELILYMNSQLTTELTASSLQAWHQYSQCPHLQMLKPVEKVSEYIQFSCAESWHPPLASIRHEHSLVPSAITCVQIRKHQGSTHNGHWWHVTDLDSVYLCLALFLSRCLAVSLLAYFSSTSCFFLCVSPCFYQALSLPTCPLALAGRWMTWMSRLVWFWGDLKEQGRKNPEPRLIILRVTGLKCEDSKP